MEAGGVPAAALVNRAPASPADVASQRPLQGVWLDQSHGAEERSHTAQSAGWEDAIALLARNTAVGSEPPAESLRSCNSTASMKVKNVKKLSLTKRHFPRLAECAHFHYDNVDVGSVQLSLAEDQSEVTRGDGLDTKELTYLVQICCQGQTWIVKRSYEDFRVLDKHLHLCIYDRRFSQLLELPRFDSLKDEPPSQMLTAYLSRLSAIADNKINCGPALTWMEIDNKGNHLLVHDESSINVPAVAAAHVIKRYTAQAADELSFEVGDIVSVIDMPPKEDTGWWRGKHGFQVGFFPAECVELISEKVPPNMTGSLPKPVCKKHGKLITFLRSFVKSRPTKQKLRQCGILRERVFGCDLGEHLLNSGRDVPQVIKSCTEFIEKCGVVDGIYRLSGVASNIQKLRHEFDSEHVPDLSKDVTIQDIHSVGSLCKLYFRELPNPLLTYQLYDRFSDAVSAATNDERLVKIHDVIQQLPPPHYRTLEFLMRHLARMATFSSITSMHCKNLAIVWAPNLLRSKQIESASFSGTSAFMEVRVQSVVVEFILSHVDVLFSPRLSTLIRESAGHNTVMRPKSLLVCSPSTKLLSLEEAQARTQAQLASPVSPVSPVSPDGKYIEVGEGPTALQGKFHTVIELPAERKKAQSKVKKSPVAGWRSFFNMGKSSTAAKRKLLRHPSEPNQIKTMVLPGGRGDSGTMRSAKSEESLSSHTHEGGSGVYRSRRPRSTSDAMSTSFSEELLNSRGHGSSQSGRRDGGAGGKSSAARAPPLISPPLRADARLPLEPSSLRLGPPAEGAGAPVGGKGGSRGEAAERDRVGSLALPPDVLPKALEDRNHRHEADVAVETEVTSQPVKPGAVMFDCTPGLVRSVSLFTPQPAGKSAARILALALAESAEQASRLRKRGSSEPPTPISPLHLQDPLSLMQWPPPSPPQPQTPPVPKKDPCFSCGAFVDSSSAISAGNCTDSSSPRSTCACRDSQSGLSCSDGGGDRDPEGNAPPHHLASTRGPDAEQSPESPASVRENVRHVGVGTDAGGPDLASETDPHESLKPRLSPPENPPTCHVPEGHSATAALLSKRAANASNFRAILAEAAMPSSVQEVLPHAPVSSPSSRYQYGPTDGGMLGSLGPVYPQHWSSPLKQSDPYLQPGRQQHHTEVFSSHYSTLTPRSLHLSIKYKGQQRYNDSPGRFYGHSGPRYPPMDGASVYPTIRRVRSMHAPPEDKFFFSQRPSCQNNPYQRPVSSDIHRVQPFFEDGRVQYRYSPFPEARHPDAYRANDQGYSHSYSTHRLPVHSGRVLRSVQNVHDPRLNPPSRERSFIKEDVRPLSRGKEAVVYEALDAGLCDRRFCQSVRQGNVWNKRLPDLAVSHAHLQRGTQRCQVPVHARGKFDSGKDMLISTEGADGKYRVTMIGQYSPEHPLSEPAACQYERPERRGSGHSAKASLLLKQSCSMLSYPQPPAHHPGLQKEYSCPDFKRSDSADGGGLGGQDRLMFQTLSGCLMDDYHRARFRGQGLERSERSQSVKSHQQEAYTKRTLERDHGLAYPARRRPRTCSMFVPSRSDYTDAHASAKRKGAQPARLGTAVFPQYSCLNPQSSRLHPWALGPGAFPHSELRPETEIYAE